MFTNFRYAFSFCAVLACSVACSQRVDAAIFTSSYSGSKSFDDDGPGGNPTYTLSAAATFTFDDVLKTLVVDLAETSPAAGFQIGGGQVLTELFFAKPSSLITPSSVNTTGSTIVGTDAGGRAASGDNWAYLTNEGSNPYTLKSQITSTGYLGQSNPSNSAFFSSNPLKPLDGPSSGLVNTTNVASGVQPLIKNAIHFTFTTATGFSLSQLGSTVIFQYGTGDNDEHHFNGDKLPDGNPGGQGGQVPEPGSLLVWGLFGMAGVLHRRRHAV